MYYVIRNSQLFGPYDQGTLKTYVEDGKVLLHDKGYSKLEPNSIITVSQLLKKNRIKVVMKSFFIGK